MMTMSMPSSLSSKPKKKTIKKPAMTRSSMEFKEGDPVEVSSQEPGFLGSYYEARIMARISSRNEYVVEYKTLLEEDLSGPLREVAPAGEVRPPPPAAEAGARRFRCGDRVDAFDNDGWWVGSVGGVNEKEGRYYVYFEYFDVGIVYDVSKIRVHQDWMHGRWSSLSSLPYNRT